MSQQRWVDISGPESGITIVSFDVPMVQFGEVGTDAIVAGWKEHLEPSATMFSYPMNNYWETNYRAGQRGRHGLSYALRPHGPLEVPEAERFARGIGQPLIAIAVEEQLPRLGLLFAIESEHVVVTALKRAADGDGLAMRLYNPREERGSITIVWPAAQERRVYRSDPWERKLEPLPDQIELEPNQVLTVRVSR